MSILIAAVAVLGLAVGSFLNVVIHRVPRGESVARPGSRCPDCDRPIRVRHNIPLIGWLLLRGRCADCRAPISPRYPLVEGVTAVLFAAVTAQVAHLHLLPALPAYLFFTAAGVALTAIDLATYRLPNAIVYPTYAAITVLLAIASVAQGDPGPLLRAGVCAAALFALYLGMAIAYPAGMGLGDVKLAGIVGGVLGFLSYRALLVGAFAAFVLGGIVAVTLMQAQRGNRKTALPFGPCMVAGALLALFASAPIATAYSHLAFG